MTRHEATRRDERHLGRYAAGSAAAVVGLLLVAMPQACTKRLPHGGEDPVYPLRGLHAAVPCEGCHGPGTPKSLPTLCIDCHEADRPDPNHNIGRNCSPCHTEDGWDQVVTTLTRDTAAPTGETGTEPTTTTTFTGYDHAAIAPNMLCWTCHEVDRPDTPTPGSPTHYANDVVARAFDCGPCHGLRDWLTEGPGGAVAPYEHVARSPHGTFSGSNENPVQEWVVACVDCHPNASSPGPGVYATFDCQTCHLDLLAPPGHFGISEATPANNLACVDVCHPTGE